MSFTLKLNYLKRARAFLSWLFLQPYFHKEEIKSGKIVLEASARVHMWVSLISDYGLNFLCPFSGNDSHPITHHLWYFWTFHDV